MHPVEHLIYLSTLMVQWLIAAHPVNALFQLQLAAFYPALSHSGFDKLMIGKKLGIDGETIFIICIISISSVIMVAVLPRWTSGLERFTMAPRADVKIRERIKARDELRQRV